MLRLLLSAVVSSLFFSSLAFAGMEIAVRLSPAGSFIAKSERVSGFAYRTADGIAAENVLVDLTGLQTGIALRDKHTKDRLMVEKFPQAKLIKAVGKNGTGKALIEVKGMKQEVSGTYKINGHHVEASFPMKLKGLDITDVRYMGVGVKDEVIVSIDIPLKAAVRKAASTKKRK